MTGLRSLLVKKMMFSRKSRKRCSGRSEKPVVGLGQLRVLMFEAAYPPPVVGGKERQAHLLSRELRALGVEVRALSYVHSDDENAEHEGVPVDRVRRGVRGWLHVLTVLIAGRNQSQILHVHTPSRVGKVVALVGVSIGYTVVFKLPGQHLLDGITWRRRMLWWMVFKCVHAIVVVEEDTRSKLRKWSVPGEKVFFAKNGVELRPIKTAAWDRDQFRILFVGRLVELKRCEDLIAAVALLKDRGSRCKLRLVGEGPLAGELEALVGSLDLGQEVEFVGFSENVMEDMYDADVLVLPSRTEGMSNVLLEAMSIGLPIAASEVGSARILLGEYADQYLFPATSVEQLAGVLGTIANAGVAEEYSRYLHERCGREFSIDKVAMEYLEMYTQLLFQLRSITCRRHE